MFGIHNKLINQLLATVQRIELENEFIMAIIDDLAADVAAQKTVIDGAVVLLSGLSAQLAEAIASNDPAKIQAVKDSIDANTAALAAAVEANTPAVAAAPTPTV